MIAAVTPGSETATDSWALGGSVLVETDTAPNTTTMQAVVAFENHVAAFRAAVVSVVIVTAEWVDVERADRRALRAEALQMQSWWVERRKPQHTARRAQRSAHRSMARKKKRF